MIEFRAPWEGVALEQRRKRAGKWREVDFIDDDALLSEGRDERQFLATHVGSYAVDGFREDCREDFAIASRQLRPALTVHDDHLAIGNVLGKRHELVNLVKTH